jgi:hypothetical protein
MMKVIIRAKWITLCLGLVLVAVLLPAAPSSGAATPGVSITAPDYIPVGGNFTARITVSNLPAFVSYQIQLNYNKNVIQVQGPELGSQGITPGVIRDPITQVDAVTQVDGWHFNPPGSPGGSIRILGHGPLNLPVSGSGYLCEIHFNVLGPVNSFTDIQPTESADFENGLFDVNENKILTAPWEGTSLLEVRRPLQIFTTTLPDGAAEYVYSTNLVAIGGSPPYIWNADNLPDGLLISADGTISGTVDAAVSGNHTVTVRVVDIDGASVEKNLTMRIYPRLQITTPALPDGEKEAPYNFTLTASGGKPPYTWSSSNLPNGLSIAGNGQISGAPAGSGDFNSVSITVTDSFNSGHTRTNYYALHIGGVIHMITVALPDATVGSPYSASPAATGGTLPYAWIATGLPGGLTINPASGLISGIPVSSGNSTVILTVIDSANPHNSLTLGYALNVYVPLTVTTIVLPRLSSESGNILPTVPGCMVGVSYTGILTVTGGKAPYHWTAIGLPPGIFLSDGGVFSGNTTANGLYNNITITVRDSAAPPVTISKSGLSLKVYKVGDANGDGHINVVDITYLERVILTLSAPTAGSDANQNGLVSIGDLARIERLILDGAS